MQSTRKRETFCGLNIKQMFSILHMNLVIFILLVSKAEVKGGICLAGNFSQSQEGWREPMACLLYFNSTETSSPDTHLLQWLVGSLPDITFPARTKAKQKKKKKKKLPTCLPH